MRKLAFFFLPMALFGQMSMSIVGGGSTAPSIGGFKRSLTIDATKCGAADSANFAVLVSGVDATLKDIAHSGNVHDSGGTDILFFSDSGFTTQLPSELEKFDPTTGTVIAWVKLGTVSHTSNTTFYIAYGSTSPPTRTTNPWDANYSAVWHMPEATAANIVDSTTNARTATQHNSPTQTAGKIDGSFLYNGSTQYHGATVSSGLSASFTFEMWAKATSTPGIGEAMTSEVASYSNYWASLGEVGSNWNFSLYDGTHNPVAQSSALTTGVFYHVVGVRDTGAGKIFLYVNGALIGSGTADTTTAPTYSNFSVGAQINQASRYWPGQIGEARVSTVARPLAWILTEYNNQNAPGNIGSAGFLTWGSEGPA